MHKIYSNDIRLFVYSLLEINYETPFTNTSLIVFPFTELSITWTLDCIWNAGFLKLLVYGCFACPFLYFICLLLVLVNILMAKRGRTNIIFSNCLCKAKYIKLFSSKLTWLGSGSAYKPFSNPDKLNFTKNSDMIFYIYMCHSMGCSFCERIQLQCSERSTN